MFATNFIAAVVVLTRGVLGEGVHLLNCSPFGAAGNARVWYSLVAYCENDADCSSLGYVIPSNDRCIVSTSTTPESFHTWEGGPQNCTFPTGITFGWSIPSNAQSQPDFSSVGGAWNDFRSFDGYKDNKVNGAGLALHGCRKIYYYV